MSLESGDWKAETGTERLAGTLALQEFLLWRAAVPGRRLPSAASFKLTLTSPRCYIL